MQMAAISIINNSLHPETWKQNARQIHIREGWIVAFNIKIFTGANFGGILFLWEKGIFSGKGPTQRCLVFPHTISSKCTCTFSHANLKLPNPGRQIFFDHHLSCNPQKLTLRPPVQRTPQWTTTWKLIRFSSLNFGQEVWWAISLNLTKEEDFDEKASSQPWLEDFTYRTGGKLGTKLPKKWDPLQRKEFSGWK